MVYIVTWRESSGAMCHEVCDTREMAVTVVDNLIDGLIDIGGIRFYSATEKAVTVKIED